MTLRIFLRFVHGIWKNRNKDLKTTEIVVSIKVCLTKCSDCTAAAVRGNFLRLRPTPEQSASMLHMPHHKETTWFWENVHE